MTCAITIGFLGVAGETGIIASGTIDGTCRRIAVTVTFEDGAVFSGEVATPGTGLRDWTIEIGGVPSGVIAAACKNRHPLEVTATCVDGGSCEARTPLLLACCPDVALNKLSFASDCVQGPMGGFKAVEFGLQVDWPQGYTETLQVTLTLRPAAPPHIPVTTAVVNCTPDQSSYTEADFVGAGNGPLYVHAGFEYEVDLSIVLPERCARTVPIDRFGVPACDCPPLPDFGDLVQVYDDAGAAVPDIHALACVDGATIRIVPTQVPSGWEVAGDPAGQSIQIAADASEATVTLPADGSVTIVLITFGEGSCRETVPVSARRCLPPPADDGGGDTPGDGDQIPPDDREDVPPDDGDDRRPPGGGGGLPDFCGIFGMLFLIGVAVAAVGLALLLCPALTAPWIPPQYALVIGGALLAVGILLALFMLGLMWLFGCPLGPCTWWKWGWQGAFILGAVLIYAGFCPGCSWMLLGLLLWVLAAWLFAQWVRNCRPTVCQRYAELLLALIAFDIAALLEMALGACVITSNPAMAALWALFVIAANVVVYRGLRTNNCLAN